MIIGFYSVVIFSIHLVSSSQHIHLYSSVETHCTCRTITRRMDASRVKLVLTPRCSLNSFTHKVAESRRLTSMHRNNLLVWANNEKIETKENCISLTWEKTQSGTEPSQRLWRTVHTGELQNKFSSQQESVETLWDAVYTQAPPSPFAFPWWENTRAEQLSPWAVQITLSPVEIQTESGEPSGGGGSSASSSVKLLSSQWRSAKRQSSGNQGLCQDTDTHQTRCDIWGETSGGGATVDNLSLFCAVSFCFFFQKCSKVSNHWTRLKTGRSAQKTTG